MKTEQYQIQAKTTVYAVGDVVPEIVTPAKARAVDSAGLIAAAYPEIMEGMSGYGYRVKDWDVEKLAEHLCNASGGDWGKKNTKREYWRKKAAEQIAAEIAAIPPLIPPYWQGFATATGLAVVGYVLQAVFA